MSKWKEILTPTVIVAGLGYFVDLFDLTLFGVVRLPSLEALGLTHTEGQLGAGIRLYNLQMLGMMAGGILWGLMADKKGRVKVLFGSIFLYSAGNIANAFVPDLFWYGVCRFLTGVGLAGELGAGVALVAETLPKEKRGLGTTFVAALGMAGAVTAAIVGQRLEWNHAYILGGVLGIGLLFARLRVMESSMFQRAVAKGAKLGSPALLFESNRLWRYLACILMGLPIYFSTGVLMTFAPEIARYLGVEEPVLAGTALLFGTVGLTVGDVFSGLLSQILKSRRKAVFTSLVMGFFAFLAYVANPGWTASEIYFICFCLGFAGGYWAVLITMAAEQFGTNLRGSVASTVPNFVRGSAVLITLSFVTLKEQMQVERAILLVGLACFTIAAFAVFTLRETFGHDLDYLEE
ncbi:MAG: MFS transporter [Bdellovibrionales bacterium]|nr:MFS transporter [Bdellovibrionales bacterium]